MNRIDEQFEEALRREALSRSENGHLPEPEQLAPDAPAPRLQELVAELGEEPTARALAAWEQRLNGESILEVAHTMGLSIRAAKVLISQVHEAVREDLKENLDLNRTIDLQRIDALLATHMPRAKAGKIKSAQLVLRCIERRAKLTGSEPLPDPGRSNPQSVLIWVQSQLPMINKIVDQMPLELPPSAP